MSGLPRSRRARRLAASGKYKTMHRAIAASKEETWPEMVHNNLSFWFQSQGTFFDIVKEPLDALSQKKARTIVLAILATQVLANVVYAFYIVTAPQSAKRLIAFIMSAYVGIKIVCVVLHTVKINLADCCCRDVEGDPEDPKSYDNILVCVPAYNEGEEAFAKTVRSVVESDYPVENLYMYFIVDGNTNGSYESLMRVLTRDKSYVSNLSPGKHHMEQGLYVIDKGRTLGYTVLVKAKNKGKRDSQWLFVESLRNLLDMHNIRPKYTLFVDSDTCFEIDAIRRLWRRIRGDSDIVGVCGCLRVSNPMFRWKSTKGLSGSDVAYYLTTVFVVGFQCYEYHYNQLVQKQFESLFSGVTCLPGAFTLLRTEPLLNVEARYSDSEVRKDAVDPEILREALRNTPGRLRLEYEHHIEGARKINKDFFSHPVDGLLTSLQYDLGEDRTLTVRFLQMRKKTAYEPRAVAYTECPDNIVQLITQRRRWNNSTIINVISMLLNGSLWGQPRMAAIMLFSLVDLVSSFVMPTTSILLMYYVWDPFILWVNARYGTEVDTQFLVLVVVLLQLTIMMSSHIGVSSLFFIVITTLTSCLMVCGAWFFWNNAILATLYDFLGDPTTNWSGFLIVYDFILLHVVASLLSPAAIVTCVFAYVLLPTVTFTIPMFASVKMDDLTWGNRC